MLFIADVVSYHFIFSTGQSFESCSSLFSYFSSLMLPAINSKRKKHFVLKMCRTKCYCF